MTAAVVVVVAVVAAFAAVVVGHLLFAKSIVWPANLTPLYC